MRFWIAATVMALGLTGVADAATLFTASATGPGGPVKAYSTPGLAVTHDFTPFGAASEGARIGAARNADGRETLVVGAGPGGQTVKVFDAATGAKTHEFTPFDPAYAGGVRVAAGDVNGDGVADVVVGAGAGSGHVKVFDGLTGGALHDFDAFVGFAGGVTVASGDVNGDGFADVVVGAGAGGGPHVKVFSGQTGAELLSFFAFTPSFTGGVGVAVGRNALGANLIVGALSGGSQVGVFDTAGGLLDSFFAFDPGYLGGVSVGGGSFGGFDSILVGALTGPGQVNVYDADRRGGPLSFLGFADGGVEVAGVFDAVPEPTTWALMILGFGAAGAQLRRRRRAPI